MSTSDPGPERWPNVAAQNSETLSDDVLVVSTRAGEHGTVTLVVVGEVDTFTAPLLRATITGQLEGQSAELVLDLSGVEFLGSAGLAALVEAQKLAGDRDVALRLIATDRAVLRPLQVTGLIDLFTISDTSTAGP